MAATHVLPASKVRAAVVIRPMTAADVRVTARLQGRGLPRSFVARLGPRFLRALHRAFLRSPYVLGLVAETEGRPGEILGFALGSTDGRRHASYILRTSRGRLAAVGAPALLRRPQLLSVFVQRRAARYLRRLRSARRPAEQAPTTRVLATDGPTAVLTALVVRPGERGHGTGSALAEAFAQAATTCGSATVMLVTRVEQGADAFWKRLGWQEVDVHQNLDGDLVGSMSRELLRRSSAGER